MSTLRALNIPQDENAGAMVLRGLSTKSAQPLQMGKQDVAFKQALGPRKALGNITNKAPDIPTAGKPKLTEKRRALGDLTNNLSSANKAVTKQANVNKPQGPTGASSTLTSSVAASDLIDNQSEPLEVIWAREGIEKLAGRGWHQQEKLRQQQEDREVAMRMKMLADAVPRFALLPFVPIKTSHGDETSDDELIPEQELQDITAPSSTTPTSDLDLQLSIDVDDILGILPDIPPADMHVDSI